MAIMFRILALSALLFTHGLASAAGPLDTNRIQTIAAWLPAQPAGLGRPITDRASWQQFSNSPAAHALLAKAKQLATQPVPAVSDDQFLDFSRTGNRDRYQSILYARSDRLETLALAECLEDQGRFIPPLADTIQALCQERTWVYPAHDAKLNNFYGRTVELDLRATILSWELATADYLLGDKLPSATRTLLHENVRRRVLQPFRDMVEGRQRPLFWLNGNNNWNAVCLAGVTGAALAVEDSPQERAYFVAAAEHYIRNFLSGFTPDGYCSEGLGYWNYGFGHFLQLSETIRQGTGGHLDLLADPAAFAPAMFCTRSEILNGLYPTISDCAPGTRPSPQYVTLIKERFGLNIPAAPRMAPLTGSRSLPESILFSFLPSQLPVLPHPADTADSSLRSWFKDGGVLICRADAGKPFAAVLKGGHNAESHNHNDVGSFSLVVGNRMVVCDPGGEVYTARTFSPHRYESKVLSSYGHAVPVVAGHLQRTGGDARAKVLRADFSEAQDTLVMDIASAYPVPELQALERTFVFNHTNLTLTVRDIVRCREPKEFETALITWGEWRKVSDTELLLTDGPESVRVGIDTGGVPFTVKSETLDEHVHTPKQPRRIGIALQTPLTNGIVTLTLTGVPGPEAQAVRTRKAR